MKVNLLSVYSTLSDSLTRAERRVLTPSEQASTDWSSLVRRTGVLRPPVPWDRVSRAGRRRTRSGAHPLHRTGIRPSGAALDLVPTDKPVCQGRPAVRGQQPGDFRVAGTPRHAAADELAHGKRFSRALGRSLRTATTPSLLTSDLGDLRDGRVIDMCVGD